MRTRLGHRSLGTLAAVAAVLATGAISNPASAATTFVRDTQLCPNGKVALGGGSQVVAEGSADFKTVLQENTLGTVNGGANSLWLSTVKSTDGPHNIGIFAVCANTPSGHQIVRKDVSVPAHGFVRDIATCPTGKVAVAGGAQVVGEGTGNFRTRMQESAPGTVNGGAQSVWLAAVSNRSTNPHTVGIFAECIDPPAGYHVVRNDVTLAPHGFVRTTANCPDGQVVLGGGASVVGEGTKNFGTVLRELAPGTLGASTSVHLAHVGNNSAKAHTIGVSAVCADPLAGYQVLRSDH